MNMLFRWLKKVFRHASQRRFRIPYSLDYLIPSEQKVLDGFGKKYRIRTNANGDEFYIKNIPIHRWFRREWDFLQRYQSASTLGRFWLDPWRRRYQRTLQIEAYLSCYHQGIWNASYRTDRADKRDYAFFCQLLKKPKFLVNVHIKWGLISRKIFKKIVSGETMKEQQLFMQKQLLDYKKGYVLRELYRIFTGLEHHIFKKIMNSGDEALNIGAMKVAFIGLLANHTELEGLRHKVRQDTELSKATRDDLLRALEHCINEKVGISNQAITEVFHHAQKVQHAIEMYRESCDIHVETLQSMHQTFLPKAFVKLQHGMDTMALERVLSIQESFLGNPFAAEFRDFIRSKVVEVIKKRNRSMIALQEKFKQNFSGAQNDLIDIPFAHCQFNREGKTTMTLALYLLEEYFNNTIRYFTFLMFQAPQAERLEEGAFSSQAERVLEKLGQFLQRYTALHTQHYDVTHRFVDGLRHLQHRLQTYQTVQKEVAAWGKKVKGYLDGLENSPLGTREATEALQEEIKKTKTVIEEEALTVMKDLKAALQSQIQDKRARDKFCQYYEEKIVKPLKGFYLKKLKDIEDYNKVNQKIFKSDRQVASKEAPWASEDLYFVYQLPCPDEYHHQVYAAKFFLLEVIRDICLQQGTSKEVDDAMIDTLCERVRTHPEVEKRNKALTEHYKKLSLQFHPDKLLQHYPTVLEQFRKEFPILPITHEIPSEQLKEHLEEEFFKLSDTKKDWEKMYKEEGCSLALMSDLADDQPTEKNRLYLEKDQNKVHYKILSDQGKFYEDRIEFNELEGITHHQLAQLNNKNIDSFKKIQASILAMTSKRGHTEEDLRIHVIDCIKNPERFESAMNRYKYDAKRYENIGICIAKARKEGKLERIQLSVESMRLAQEKDQFNQEKDQFNQKKEELRHREEQIEKALSLIETFKTAGQEINISEKLVSQDDSKEDHHKGPKGFEVYTHFRNC